MNALIDEANEQWDERNARAAEAGEPEVPRMLPLVRLKVRDLFLPNVSTTFIQLTQKSRSTQQVSQKPPTPSVSGKNSKAALPTHETSSSSTGPKSQLAGLQKSPSTSPN